MWGIYIPHFDQISVKISVFGVLYPYRCTNGVKFGMEERGPLLHAKSVTPAWQKASKSASE